MVLNKAGGENICKARGKRTLWCFHPVTGHKLNHQPLPHPTLLSYLCSVQYHVTTARGDQCRPHSEDAQECWGWLLRMERFYTKINGRSFIQHWQTICLSLIARSSITEAPQILHVWLQKSSWNRSSLSWGILWLAPAVKHITGVHGCVTAPWKTWAERGIWTERAAV